MVGVMGWIEQRCGGHMAVRPLCHVFCLSSSSYPASSCSSCVQGPCQLNGASGQCRYAIVVLGPTAARSSSVCVCCLGTLTVGWNGVSRVVGRVIDWVSWDVGWVLPYTPHGLWVGRWAGLSWAVGLVPLPPPHNSVKYADG